MLPGEGLTLQLSHPIVSGHVMAVWPIKYLGFCLYLQMLLLFPVEIWKSIGCVGKETERCAVCSENGDRLTTFPKVRLQPGIAFFGLIPVLLSWNVYTYMYMPGIISWSDTTCSFI
jgi:hypothetical protein